MSSFFTPSVPSYAEEQLGSHLSALATIPITTTTTAQSHHFPTSPSPALQSALQDLTSNGIVSREKLISILECLSSSSRTQIERTDVETQVNNFGAGDVDVVLEAEVMTRLITIVWKEVMQSLVDAALKLEEEKAWWDANLTSRRGVVMYTIQTMPQRLYEAILETIRDRKTTLPPLTFSSFSRKTLRALFTNLQTNLRLLSASSTKRPTSSLSSHPPNLPSTALIALSSPFALTRREMLRNRKALGKARDEVAIRVGVLASQGPRWNESVEISVVPNVEQDSNLDSAERRDQEMQSKAVERENLLSSFQVKGTTTPTNPSRLLDEASRVHTIICQVLQISPSSSSNLYTPLKRSRSDTITPPPPPSISTSPTPTSLLSILHNHLPTLQSSLTTTLSTHARPPALVRFWIPLILTPAIGWGLVRILVRNKQWLQDQVKVGKETVKGFFVSWVWEPIEGIINTLRTGGEGLGVAPTTVESDQASLQRMVLDLGRDYYHLDGPALDKLAQKVKKGDMEEVLRVYEKELQSPLKNALMGSLVRTLLIQVQKTKTDLSLSLLSLDHLLRSQQLTFAFVGVAPSFLVLYGLGGWLRSVYRGEKRGQGRRRKYFESVRKMTLRNRNVEQLLITSPEDDKRMSEKDRGLIIVSVSGLRSWAAGLGRNRDAFVNDLRMIEDPSLMRDDKLRVVERIWRCWGIDGRGSFK